MKEQKSFWDGVKDDDDLLPLIKQKWEVLPTKKRVVGVVCALTFLLATTYLVVSLSTGFDTKFIIEFGDGCNETYVGGVLTTPSCVDARRELHESGRWLNPEFFIPPNDFPVIVPNVTKSVGGELGE